MNEFKKQSHFMDMMRDFYDVIQESHWFGG